MSICERCWATAYDPQGDQVARYMENLTKHKCTPEQQAGPGAYTCPECGRQSLHQYTREAMCKCPQQEREVRWPHGDMGEML